jgi:hypothetical protein
MRLDHAREDRLILNGPTLNPPPEHWRRILERRRELPQQLVLGRRRRELPQQLVLGRRLRARTRLEQL